MKYYSCTGGSSMKVRLLPAIAFLLSLPLAAQWLKYTTPGIPRLADGKPNLSAPVPRTADGKPDLYGLWIADKPPQALAAEPLLEIQPGAIVLTPEGEARQRRRKEKYFPGAQCLPDNLPKRTAVDPFKILTLRGMVVILYEENTTYRQIFTDGRKLPNDPN